MNASEVRMRHPKIHYALIVPMQKELQGLFPEDLTLSLRKKYDSPFPGALYQLSIQGKKTCWLSCIESGIGKCSVALALSWLHAYYPLHAAILAGTCGALHQEIQIGDCIVADAAHYHDVDLSLFGHAVGFLPKNPLFLERSLNILNVYPNFYASLIQALAKPSWMHRGSLVCGESFIAGEELYRKIQLHFPEALGVDMESASFAQACQTYKIPWLILRSISDRAASSDAPTHFQNNLSTCFQKLKRVVSSVFDLLGRLDNCFPDIKNGGQDAADGE